MKKVVYFLFPIAALLLWNCKGDDSIRENCNHLLNVGVSLEVNLNLPQFSGLNFTNGTLRVDGQGNGGILLINTGNTIRAFDGVDPNHSYSNCSNLTIEGILAVCNCEDENTYNLAVGGLPEGNQNLRCTLLEYRVDNLGSGRYLVNN